MENRFVALYLLFLAPHRKSYAPQPILFYQPCNGWIILATLEYRKFIYVCIFNKIKGHHHVLT